MRHFIFSYGSLAHREVAEKTAPILNLTPAYLTGYARNFRALVRTSKFAAAGVEERRESRILGMMVEVDESSLALFDEREAMYDRVEIDPERLHLVSSEPLPDGFYYLYVPKDPQCPTNDIPVIQSYLDVIVQAFLPHGEVLTKELIMSFQDLDRPWINDRQMPRYSRYLEDAETKLIDGFLNEHRAELFESRGVMDEEIKVKPELVAAIMKTIVFHDLFDFPLTIEEVQDLLYKYNKPLHIKELRATLNRLAEQGKLSYLKDYYVLAGRETIIETRKTRKFIAEKFWARTKQYGQYMRAVPFVKMVAVCNNLAYDNPNEQSDIDLFIVVKPGRMWLSRFIITLILQFYGVRRHGDKIAGRFCLSFFVTSEKLRMNELELKPEDPYLAYWTKNLTPIFGETTYKLFKNLNSDWLSSYGLKFTDHQLRHLFVREKRAMKRFGEWLFGGFVGDAFEKLLKKTLKVKTLKSMNALGPESNVVVTDDMLKFHNHDRRQEYFEAWRANS